MHSKRALAGLLAAALAITSATGQATLAVAAEPTTALFAVGGLGFDESDYLTPPGWEFIQAVDEPIDFSDVTVFVRNASNIGQRWYLKFAGPTGEPLVPGTYSFETSADSRPAGSAGLGVLVTGGGCSYPHGSFTIYELTRDATGIATQFSASFDVRCDVADNPGAYTHGELNINSTRSWTAWTADTIKVDITDAIVGTPARAPVTITSFGTEPVTLQAEIGSYNASEFALDDVNQCLGQPIMPGASCSLDIVFTGAVHGQRFAQLWLSADGFRSVWTVGLWGYGRDPTSIALSVSSSSAPYPGGFYATGLVTGGDGRGGVSFEVDGESFGWASLYQGAAETVVRLPPGDYQLVAHYLGDTYSAESWSAPVTVHGVLATSVTLDLYHEATGYRMYARVIPPGAYDLSGGTLTIVETTTGRVLATTTVSGRFGELVASCTNSGGGTQEYEARYSGDGLFQASLDTWRVFGCIAGDVLAPTGSVAINGNAQYATSADVVLSLSASDPAPGSGVASVQISQVANSWPNAWQQYQTSLLYTLTGADGDKQVFVRFRDGVGNVSSVSTAHIVLDRSAPPAIPPSEAFSINSIVSKLVPIVVSYASADATSGTAGYELNQSSNGGASYTAVPVSPAVSSTVRTLSLGTVYRFQSRATDAAGNRSPWTAGPTVKITRVQDGAAGVSYSGAWKKTRSSKASGGTFRVASAAGSTVTFAFNGRDIAWFARMGPNAGQARVFIDGVQVGPDLDLYSATKSWRRVVFAASLATSGPHTIKVQVLGTKRAASTGTQVTVDGFLVIQ